MEPAVELSEAVGEPAGAAALPETAGRSPTMPPMEFLGRWYARRIVNVNVNVIVAGMLAMALTLIPVHLTRHVGINTKWVIVAITLGFDICFDVAIYYLLHWLANHWQAFPWVKHRKPHRAGMSFIRDASLVQFERALLGPVYYGVALGIQYATLHHLGNGGDHRELATVVGLGGGLLVTRVIHTAWMIWSDRRWAKRCACQPAICCPSCGEALPLADAACPVCALKDAATDEHRRKDSA
jgi:hypothetical protein